MGFSDAVQWWEEWQLRILVLGSLFIQCFLFFAGILRKHCIPSWLRFFIWLAYVGSDAVAIYALATLFNRNKEREWVSSSHRSSVSLQALWARILLVHLGGQNGITAYNIEDNELWRRHVLTTVSQVTVALYVFTKSSLHGRIYSAGYYLFLFGILKCFLKPWDLKRASINSLVDSSRLHQNSGYFELMAQAAVIVMTYVCTVIGGHPLDTSESNDLRPQNILSLHQYVRTATQYFSDGNGDRPSGSSESNELRVEKLYDLLVDLAPSYFDRYSCLKHLVHDDGENVRR